MRSRGKNNEISHGCVGLEVVATRSIGKKYKIDHGWQ